MVKLFNLKSGDAEFKSSSDHCLDLSLACPSFNSPAALAIV